MTSTINNLNSNDFQSIQKRVIKAFSKLFKQDEKQVAKMIDSRLFHNCSNDLARVFETASKANPDKLINVIISLEYLATLDFEKDIKEALK